MEFKESKTEDVLRKALSAELRQSFEYRYFAEVARQANLPQVTEIFEATATNETEHARHEYEFLGGAGDIVINLQQAITNEHEQVARFYPQAAETAAEEGFTDIADFFRRIVKVEAKHEKNFRELLSGVEKGAVFEGRTVGHSAVEMAQLMLPAQANPAGFVHGGELMKLMDNAAGVVAARHAHSNVVTARVEDIVFHTPVRVGSLVIVKGRLVFTSRSSMQIRVEVEMESMAQERRVSALTADFVMVALDATGKSTTIPKLILQTEEEEKLFADAEERYKVRKK
jgi:acyl-CoA hydrolase